MSDGLKGTILENATMKPMMVLPPGAMSAEHQRMLRDNGLCVVESERPEVVRFMDPISSIAERPDIENAAIEMSRILLNGIWGDYDRSLNIGQETFAKIFVGCLLKGTSLSKNPKRNIDQEIFDTAKHEEIRRLAREEAKAERAAAKATKKTGAKT